MTVVIRNLFQPKCSLDLPAKNHRKISKGLKDINGEHNVPPTPLGLSSPKKPLLKKVQEVKGTLHQKNKLA